MQIANWLDTNIKLLKSAGIDSARLDALLLLGDELNKSREWLLAHLDSKIKPSHLSELNTKIVQRTSRVPLAYLRQRQEFYGRQFWVDDRVLIPRPESEDMISLLLSQVNNSDKLTVLDIGTGSGCLAITAKLELPNSTVVATDKSDKALKVAAKNAVELGAKIHFYKADLLDLPKAISPDVILANLPYVPDELITSPEITKEPSEALFSGSQGLDHYRLFWQQLAAGSLKPRFVITESLDNQHSEISQLASKANYTLENTLRLSQLFKLAGE